MCEKAGIEYLLGYEHRVFDGVTSTETVDRYGDIVRFNGAQFVNYLKNPVVMLSHAHDQFPIGNSIQISKDQTVKGIRSYDLYVDDRVDSSGRADLAFKFRKSGLMPGISIGFMVIAAKSDHTAEEKNKLGLGKWGIEILEFDYLEHSQVAIPANPEALTKMLKTTNQDLLRSTFCKDDLSFMESTNLLSADLIEIFEKFTIGNGKKVFDFKFDPELKVSKVILDNGTILAQDNNSLWCESGTINNDTDKKLDEILHTIKSLPEKIASSIASKPEDSNEGTELYTEDLLSDFNLKPKF